MVPQKKGSVGSSSRKTPSLPLLRSHFQGKHPGNEHPVEFHPKEVTQVESIEAPFDSLCFDVLGLPADHGNLRLSVEGLIRPASVKIRNVEYKA